MALKSLALLGAIVPPNVVQYSSPVPRLRLVCPAVPGLGGMTETGPFLPEIFALIMKLPEGVFLIEATATGP